MTRQARISISPNYVNFAIILALAGLLWAVIGLIVPQLFSAQYAANLMQDAALLGIVAIGQTLVILTRGIDLTVAAIVILVNILAGELMAGETVLLPALIGLAIGTLVGALNGIGIAMFKIPPIIMTLAAMIILEGVVFLHTQGVVRGSAPDTLVAWVNAKSLGMSHMALIWLGASALMILCLRLTVWGRQVQAVGANAEAAAMAGVPVARTLISVYAISGFMAALAGILLVSYLGNPVVRFTGQSSYMLDSIAAVVIGGTLLTGGHGGVERTVIGVLIFKFLFSALVILQVGIEVRMMLTGVVIIIVPILYARLFRMVENSLTQ